MSESQDTRLAGLWLSLLLGLATLAVFWPVTTHEFINFDDPEYIYSNPHAKAGLGWPNVAWAFTTRYAGNWHPLVWLSHMLDWQIFGANAGGHHLVNLLWHTASTILLFLVLKQLTGAIWRSAFVAALFALHPLHVESVAWASERKDVLSAFFFMLTLLAYARYARESSVSSPKSMVFYGISLLLFALGLMSKPMLVTLPFVLLLLDYWPLGRFAGFQSQNIVSEKQGLQSAVTRTWPLIREKLPFFVLSLASCAVTFWVQRKNGAVSSVSGLPVGPRLANAIVSYASYFAKTIWPAKLAIYYPHPDSRFPVSDQLPLWQIVGIGIALLAVCGFVILRARSRPYLTVGWFWYLGMLVPVIGLVQVGGQAMADRYAYLPLIGLFLMCAWWIPDVLARWPHRRTALALAGVMVLAACGMTTSKQLAHWQNSITLFTHTIAVTKYNGTAHVNLGAALEAKGYLAAALEHYTKSLEIEPDYADARYDIGHILASMGKTEEAIGHYQAVFRLKPDHLFAHLNLGNALLGLGKTDQAIEQYLEALRIKPEYASAHNNLGKAYLDQGKLELSAHHFAEAARLEPDHVEAQNGLALALAAQGNYTEALPRLREAVRRTPNSVEANFYLGNALTDAGQPEAARPYFAAVVRLSPDLPEKHKQAGRTLAAKGDLEAALARYTAAVRLVPEDADAQQNVGVLLARTGRVAEAIPHLSEVTRLRPADAEAYYNLALAFTMQGKCREALVPFRKTLELRADWPAALNDLAWILATHPDAEVRNGEEAVRFAEKACRLTDRKEARYLGTLDAAYAETGRFSEAIEAGRQAQSLALAAGQNNVAEAAERRLELYRAGRPFRQPAQP